MKRPSPAFTSTIIFFLIWEMGARYLGLLFILPWPTAILKKTWDLREPLFKYHLPATLEIAVVSILLSLFLGMFLAILMDRSEYIEKSIYPIIVTTQTIPITALAPIFILWFGYTIWSKILVSVIIAFFPITITLHDGLKATKQDYIELFKSMNASDWDIFMKLKVPSVIPYFFSSLKIAIPLVLIGAAIGEWLGANAGLGYFSKDIFMKLKVPSVIPYFFSSLKIAIPLVLIGAAIGEWLGANAGLGYFSKRMMTQLDGAGVFAPIVLISVIAIIFVQLITIIEKKILVWREK